MRLVQQWSPVLRIVILVLICLMAVLIRVFSVRFIQVIRFESVIHEFDPWFNYRTTKFLVERGPDAFWNWFDTESWYPLGRAIGGTIYPGLMATAAAAHKFMHFAGFPVDIRNVCVFLAPAFSALTALATYLLTKEVTGRAETGMFSALFISVVPSYLSRSVAGSYDNEGIAIFLLVATFFLYIHATKTGSLLWAAGAALSFFYMAAAWGGYAFIINMIPIYVVGLILLGQFCSEIYISYCVFYVLGNLLAMQIPFIGFLAVTSSEHLASHLVFLFVQVYVLGEYVKAQIGEQRFKTMVKTVVWTAAALCALFALYMTVSGKLKWSGRSLSLLDPTYAKKFIPIIASVSEHQPTTWTTFFFDLHLLLVFAPVGLYECLVHHSRPKLFIALYSILSVYFACVMVRLTLVLAPALCVLAGIGLSTTLQKFKRRPVEISVLVVGMVGALVSMYIFHCVWVGAEAYSSPTIIMANKSSDGSKQIVDDYREAYY